MWSVTHIRHDEATLTNHAGFPRCLIWSAEALNDVAGDFVERHNNMMVYRNNAVNDPEGRKVVRVQASDTILIRQAVPDQGTKALSLGKQTRRRQFSQANPLFPSSTMLPGSDSQRPAFHTRWLTYFGPSFLEA